MKLTLITALVLATPVVAQAQGQAQFTVELTAVACVYSASNELEDCRIVVNPVRETITAELENTTIGDWSVNSKKTDKAYSLRAPQMDRDFAVEVSVEVLRNADPEKPEGEKFTLGAEVVLAPAPGIGSGFSMVSFADPKGFKRYHVEGVRKRFPLSAGKSLEMSPQLEVTNLSFLD